MREDLKSANRQIIAVTNLGAVTNLLLSALKLIFGLLSGSVALLADAVHSISDLATDLAVLLGVHFGSKEPDIEHPYGHGRFETFATMFVALLLAVAGGGMIYKAGMSIAQLRYDTSELQPPGISVLVVAVISIIAKEALYWITRTVANKHHCAALYANAWHHRTDALSSIAVAGGYGAARMGYPYGDQLAAITVGLLVILMAAKIFSGCVHEFAERSVDYRTMKQIEQIIASRPRIHSWHNLRTRSIGREVFMDLHILVDSQLNITEAHEIAEALERALHEHLTRPVNITVHVEPDIPPLRK